MLFAMRIFDNVFVITCAIVGVIRVYCQRSYKRDGSESEKEDVPTDNYLFVALIDIVFTDGSKRTCTGTIIHDNVVITAAHCFSKEDTQPELTASFVVIGSKKMFDTGYEQYLPMERVIVHPNYSGWTADLALVYTFAGMVSDKPGRIVRLASEKTTTDSEISVFSWGRCKEEEVMTTTLFTKIESPCSDESAKISEEDTKNKNNYKSTSMIPSDSDGETFKTPSFLALRERNEDQNKVLRQKKRKKKLRRRPRNPKIQKPDSIIEPRGTRMTLKSYRNYIFGEETNRFQNDQQSHENLSEYESREHRVNSKKDTDEQVRSKEVKHKKTLIKNRDPDIEEIILSYKTTIGKKYDEDINNRIKRKRKKQKRRLKQEKLGEYSEFTTELRKIKIATNSYSKTLSTKGNNRYHQRPHFYENFSQYDSREYEISRKKKITNLKQEIETSTYRTKRKERRKPHKFVSQYKNNWRRVMGNQKNRLIVEEFGFVNTQACKKLVQKAMPPLYKIDNPNEILCYSSDEHYITEEDSGAPAMRLGRLVAVTVGGIKFEGEHVALGLKIVCFCSWIANNLPKDGTNIQCCKNCCEVKEDTDNHQIDENHKHSHKKRKYRNK